MDAKSNRSADRAKRQALDLLLDRLRESVENGHNREATMALLWGLHTELANYFTEQEQALAATMYPGVKAHRFEHSVILLNLHATARELTNGTLTAPRECLERFSDRLEAHFELSDHRVAPYTERAQLLQFNEAVAS